jgi:hypothetical protein
MCTVTYLNNLVSNSYHKTPSRAVIPSISPDASIHNVYLNPNQGRSLPAVCPAIASAAALCRDIHRTLTTSHLVPVPGRIILRTNHQTPPLLCSPIHRLQNIHQLALVLEHPVQLIVITRPKIAHHMLVTEEEHDGHRIVQFVHGLKVRHLVQVAQVDGRKVLDAVGDFVQDLVLRHAVGVAVAAEADHDEPVFFGEDGLVDVPAGAQVGEDDGAHGGGLRAL